MALLTRAGSNKLLRRIYETGGLTPDMEADIERLKKDFDEREGILRLYGEVYDGEDVDEYEYKGKEVSEFSPSEDHDSEWRAKYEEMRNRYLDRFFGGEEIEEIDDNMRETEEDVKRDGTSQTFEELLMVSEG